MNNNIKRLIQTSLQKRIRLGYSENHKDLREMVTKYAKERIKPLAHQTDSNNSFPNELWTEMGELGLLGVTCPEQYGGIGMDYTAHCIVMEELSRASGSIGLSYGAHTALNLAQLVRHGNSEQKQKYLPKLCSGEFVGALSMSEPNAGSDVVSMKTTATKQSDGKYVLNGTKMWCTNGPDADVLVVYAKTDIKAHQHGITAFLVEKGQPGFTTHQKLDKLGMRGSNTCELVFDNVEVDESQILGEVNKGVYVMMSGLDYERLVLAAGPVGIMQAVMDDSLDYLQTREQFKQKIGQFQIMQAKIADMYVMLNSSRAYLYKVSDDVDNGIVSNTDCCAIILQTSKMATQMALEGIQCLGGNGYINDYAMGRYLRDAKLYEIGAGTNEIRQWVIGRELFKNGYIFNH